MLEFADVCCQRDKGKQLLSEVFSEENWHQILKESKAFHKHLTWKEAHLPEASCWEKGTRRRWCPWKRPSSKVPERVIHDCLCFLMESQWLMPKCNSRKTLDWDGKYITLLEIKAADLTTELSNGLSWFKVGIQACFLIWWRFIYKCCV